MRLIWCGEERVQGDARGPVRGPGGPPYCLRNQLPHTIALRERGIHLRAPRPLPPVWVRSTPAAFRAAMALT